MIWSVGFLTRFRNDRSGGLAIIAGLSFMILCLAMGMAYDSSRLASVTTRVQSALDAAALAAAKVLDQDNSTDAQVAATARAYFDAHRAEITMNGLQLGAVVAVADRSTSTVKVTLNGSISSLVRGLIQQTPRIDFVRKAETTYKTRRIELSLVLDVTGSMAGARIDGLKAATKDLVDTLFATNPNPGAIRVSLVPYSASVNAGGYWSAATGSFWGADSCVVERDGASTDTDTGPDQASKLRTSSVMANPQYSCPTAPVEPLTDLWDPAQRDAFKARIDAMTPNGGTAGHIGLAWGWYMLSDKWASMWPSNQRPKPASPDITKAVILMTDGEFNSSYLPSNTNATNAALPDSAGDQALRLCSNMKLAPSNIEVYAIAFQAPVSAENLLQSCSGPANYFDAANASDLISAFREIAERLTTLRISS